MIHKWFKEFLLYHKNLNYDLREGQPRITVTPEHIEAVKKLIALGNHVMCDEIERCVNI